MTENEIARHVVDAAYKVHVTLGPGLLESVYEAALAHELSRRGLSAVRQQAIPIKYDGVELGEGFRADLVVEQKVIIELKSTKEDHEVFLKQLLTYLKLSDLRLGLLINFGHATIKKGIKRVANGMANV